MFGDTVFNPVLDIERVVGVSRVVRGNWHDPCGQQVVMPVKRVGVLSPTIKVGLATASASRVTCIAVYSGACLLSVNSAAIGIFDLIGLY